MITMYEQDEFILAKGNIPFLAALHVFDPIDLQGEDHVSIYLAAEQGGTWLVEGKVAGQWIPLATGNYKKNVLHVLFANSDLPPYIRLSVTPAITAGHLFASYRIYETKYSTAIDPATLPTLTWAAGVTASSFIQLFERSTNPTFALTYDGAGHVTIVDKVDGGSTYRKTLTWLGDNLTAISAWVEV